MNFIKENYKKVWKFIKKNLSKAIIVCSIIFVICTIIGIVFGIKYSEETKAIITEFMNSNKELILEEGKLSVLGIIENNSIACLTSILFGIIPFLFLTGISLVTNGFMIGIVLGFGKATAKVSIFKTFVCGLLPHGIFEIPALILSMSMGIYLCLNITMKIFKKGKLKISVILKEYLRIFISLIIPLLLIAGVVESYITPLLLK